MRVRVDITTQAAVIPWPDVHGPARAVAYGLIGSQNAGLARRLAAPRPGIVPVGVCPPRFEGAPRRAGVYATSERGAIWFGSPLPIVSAALLAGIADHNDVQWGSVTCGIEGVHLEHAPPDHQSGRAIFETHTPVLIKHDSRYILPDHPRFPDELKTSLVKRADALGLPNDVELTIAHAGGKRLFDVQGKARIGATIRVCVSAAPVLLDALYVGGIGLSTNQGFGWIGLSTNH